MRTWCGGRGRLSFAIVLWVIVAGPFAAGSEPFRLRVVTFNIHHGEGTDGKLDLPRIADVIHRLRPDVVALQEVDRGTARSGGVDQAAELGRLTGLQSVFGKAMDYAGGQYGQAILSRFPVSEVQVHSLPTQSGCEPRCVLVAKCDPEGHAPFFLANTHLEHARASARLCQAGKLGSLLAPIRAPLILAGDLNDTPGSAVLGVLRRHWLDTTADRAGPTWPSTNPHKQLDYVLVRPADPWKIVEVRVVEDAVASDHCAVLVELEHVTAVSDSDVTNPQRQTGRFGTGWNGQMSALYQPLDPR